jgi:membrane associated rhomboid family serine protease
MGAYLVLHPTRRVTVLLMRIITQVPAWVAVGMWFVFQIISSLTPSEGGVAYWAHIGGFIVGAAFGGVYRGIRKPPEKMESYGRYWSEGPVRQRW